MKHIEMTFVFTASMYTNKLHSFCYQYTSIKA